MAAIAPSYALSRLMLLAITCVAAIIRRQSPIAIWDQWDAKWYLGIAAHGYHWSLHGKPALAFFPLYPLLIRLITGLGVPGGLAALVLSNVAFAAALLYLYLFVHAERGTDVARRAVCLLALFPTAFFTFAPYTESLFLLCAIAALYHARRGDALIAGLWLAAALATRSTGLVLLPAMFLMFEHRRWRSTMLAVTPVLVAVGAYVWYLQSQHLTITELVTSQRAWHRALTYPWTGFSTSVLWLAQHGAENAAWAGENILQLGVTAIFLAATVVAWRSIGRAQALYCAAFWLLVLTSPQWLDDYYAPFSSMDRFILALFPLVAWFAAHTTQRTWRHVLRLSALLMSTLAAVHLAGGWVG